MEAIKLCRLDTPIIFIEARINLSRFVVTDYAAKTSATVTFPRLNLISLFAFCFNIWLNGVFFFSSRRRHTRCSRDWSSDVCSSDLVTTNPTTVTQVQLTLSGSRFVPGATV